MVKCPQCGAENEDDSRFCELCGEQIKTKSRIEEKQRTTVPKTTENKVKTEKGRENMNIGEIISESLRYPSSDWKKVIILGIFYAISILIIPLFLFLGYVFRIIKSTLDGSDELPDFDEWSEMFVDGLKVFVVGIVYFIIPSIVIIAGFAASYSVQAGTFTNPGLLAGALIIGIMLAIIFGLIETIATANMALSDSELGAAFRFSEILERISMIGWGKYIIWYIMMIVIGFVGSIIAGLLNIIPILGFIIAWLVVYPYLYMLHARSLALVFASSEEAREKPVEKPAAE
jgi:MFS family permease